MFKTWGLGITAAVATFLIGCQLPPVRSTSTVRPVENAAQTASVRSVRTSDYLGHWIGVHPTTSLYLGRNHQLVLFQRDRPTLRGRFTLHLAGQRATLKIANQPAVQLTLADANQLSVNQTQLTKDPTWQPATSSIPTSATSALNALSETIQRDQ
ncbi:hypothetical protein [Lactiplantibacillus modestisalitolerans]|uniref:Lipoprotein n=1 Tax=Lactiplantibacillus modestisalitolerans TaxID=1457219 RepID=A0ABV5WSX2_9LACO|nr:hypothetical protein [Lactiplantibacillus modestisalitolerans]